MAGAVICFSVGFSSAATAAAGSSFCSPSSRAVSSPSRTHSSLISSRVSSITVFAALLVLSLRFMPRSVSSGMASFDLLLNVRPSLVNLDAKLRDFDLVMDKSVVSLASASVAPSILSVSAGAGAAAGCDCFSGDSVDIDATDASSSACSSRASNAASVASPIVFSARFINASVVSVETVSGDAPRTSGEAADDSSLEARVSIISGDEPRAEMFIVDMIIIGL